MNDNEEIKEDKTDPLMKHELVEIIDSSLQVLATLDELASESYGDEKADIVTVKSTTYRIIFAAQRKLLKLIKET